MPIAAQMYYRFFEGSSSHHKLPVLLIHGAGGDHLYWPPQIRRLTDQRVYALDLPGHGRSAGVGLQRISDYARAVWEWMAEIELNRAIIVGHSMGGAIAQEIALTYPEQVAGLGLVASGAHLPVNPELLEATAHPTTFQKAVRLIVKWSFHPQADASLVDLAQRRLSEVRPALLGADLSACDHFDLRERLSEIRQPALVVCGADDKMTPPRYSRYLVENIPSAELRIIPEAGHMLMLEKPDVIAGHLSEFVSSLPSALG